MENVSQRFGELLIGDDARRSEVDCSAHRFIHHTEVDGLLLPSLRVVPVRLQQARFVFTYPELEPALRHLLGQ